MEEKGIAVMIPAWKESDVLEAMVRTNLTRLKYKNYRWFIGVYPNDIETVEIAKRLESLFPEKIKVVVTDRPGPTSKAHCLNCIMKEMDEWVAVAKKEGKGWMPHFVAIHDAEDVIHPDSFVAINAEGTELDFIQLPIFSLPVPVKKWVAGTYLDEFAEIHLKEIPIRQKFNMPIPSAGVGTFFSWDILEMLNRRFGYCFDENNLTEDYEVSQRIARLGGKQSFLLVRDETGGVVATREYFPDTLGRSIRQKTRWTTGICLQTAQKWGQYGRHQDRSMWLSDIATSYALYRDRKALWANPAAFVAWALAAIMVIGLGGPVDSGDWRTSGVQILLGLNAFLFAIRLAQRARFTAVVYGRSHGLMAVPRMFASNVINGMASILAIRDYLSVSRKKKGSEVRMEWAKTDHKFPGMDELGETEKAG